jgi:hypothetical protein
LIHSATAHHCTASASPSGLEKLSSRSNSLLVALKHRVLISTVPPGPTIDGSGCGQTVASFYFSAGEVFVTRQMQLKYAAFGQARIRARRFGNWEVAWPKR